MSDFLFLISFQFDKISKCSTFSQKSAKSKPSILKQIVNKILITQVKLRFKLGYKEIKYFQIDKQFIRQCPSQLTN